MLCLGTTEQLTTHCTGAGDTAYLLPLARRLFEELDKYSSDQDPEFQQQVLATESTKPSHLWISQDRISEVLSKSNQLVLLRSDTVWRSLLLHPWGLTKRCRYNYEKSSVNLSKGLSNYHLFLKEDKTAHKLPSLQAIQAAEAFQAPTPPPRSVPLTKAPWYPRAKFMVSMLLRWRDQVSLFFATLLQP